MTKALKEILENAPIVNEGTFRKLMFVSNGMYNGFWGKNGYDNMWVLGCDMDGNWVKLGGYIDVFSIMGTKGSLHIDIDHKYEIPALWFSRPIHIDYSLEISSMDGEEVAGAYI